MAKQISEEELKAREMDHPRKLSDLSINDSKIFGEYHKAFWYLVGQFSFLELTPKQQLELWKMGVKMFDEIKIHKLIGRDLELETIDDELKIRNESK